MSEKFFLEKSSLNPIEKELVSDSCLEKIVTNIHEYKDFYTSRLVLDTEKEEFGFSAEERSEMVDEIKKLQENIIDEYEKNENINIKERSHLSHLIGNSILVNAEGQALRYEKGKIISITTKERIKREIELLNYYTRELNKDNNLLEEELIHEDGYLQKFTKLFSGEIDPRSPNRILIFKFFRDLETTGIKKDDLSSRLEEIDERTRINNFLDVQKLEQEGLLLIRENGDETYKYI